MQLGGGINSDNAMTYIKEGASHVIVTSYVFSNGQMNLERLKHLVGMIGKQRLVLDLSCRKKNGKYAIVTDRWQKFSDVILEEQTLEFLATYADEFLVHGVDVEGKRLGIDEELVTLLGCYSPIPVTYAGGVSTMEELDRIKTAGKGHVDVTVGSSLDIFGGNLQYEDVVAWHNNQQLMGLGPYSESIKKAEKEIKEMVKKINDLCGIKESDTGLATPSQWDLVSDKQMMQEEQPLQVARCTKIISPNTEDAKYVINVKQIAKFVVGLGDKVSPTDIEEAMRVGVDRNMYQIQIPLPPKIDPSVTMMTVEEKPDVTYNDVGGCKEQIEKMREVVELPMLHPEKFVKLGIDPPKGVLCYGPPGTGKTLLARAEGARMVRELFQMARSKKACIVFFDEVDAIGGARFDDGVGGDNEVQRTMLEIVNQLDGFDARGNIKVLMATNRPDTLDPALLRPGRLDRKVEFGLPDLEGRTKIFKIHTKTMNCERDIRFELLARLCPNSTGADIRSVCTEAGMYAIRARRKTVTEKDFLDAVNKVIKGYQKFSATPKYMVYN
uniref:1-(5-phosphoribosyl)-5-[(5-phosphoribosylamino)methylideneamino]imidazole-4-carboxamideisomerase n=1 Tax=Ananas comosus var. bracteatus TaxID=296719 RepID=A0A6V7P4C8_ANACO|nr:unnamed protein product [Ananas comosus var. bracteatus]